MEEGYNKSISDNFYYSFCNVLIVNSKKSEKEKAKKEVTKLIKEYEDIKDKDRYLEKVSEEKKKIARQIRKIEKITEDRKLLIEEYNLRNSKLPDDKKIFNVSELSDILLKEKEKYEKLILKLTEISAPSVYEENKKNIEDKIEVLKPVLDEDASLYKYLIILQKNFLKCVSKEVEAAETKEDFINLIYTIRYYRNIHLTSDKMIKEIPELNNILNKIACKLVTIMCKKSIFTIFCKDIAMNYKIILQALNSSIVDIDDIDICLKIDKETSRLIIEIYDNETIESTFEVDYQLDKKDLNVRQKKHVPLVNF